MKRYKCPDCGNEFSDGNIPNECPTCGCPSDFIQTNEIIDVAQNMKYCPQCGSVLPSQQVRFCPNCGSDLSSQKLQDIDVICPDCNTVITNINADCPICGCPSNLFVQRAKTKFLKGELLECPDCGKVFTEIIPTDCPNCGCPSDKFKKHKEEKVPQDAYTQKDSSSLAILLIIIGIGIIGSAFYFENKRSQEAAEQARQEQYEREQAEQREREREREEREAQKRKKEQEEQNKRRKKALCNNKWKCVHGDPYGQCMLETVGFETNGTAWCTMTYYAGGNKIKSSSFDFTYYIEGDYIYVYGEKAYYYDGHSLELWPSGQRLKEVSRWEF